MDSLYCKCCSHCASEGGITIEHVVLLVWALAARTLLLANVMNPPQPITRDVREKKTRSQSTYTFVRKVEHLRFQVLPEVNLD